MEKRPDESITEFTMRRIRAEIIEECAKVCESVGADEYTNVHRVIAKRLRALILE